jgi:hypothetical protein
MERRRLSYRAHEYLPGIAKAPSEAFSKLPTSPTPPAASIRPPIPPRKVDGLFVAGPGLHDPAYFPKPARFPLSVRRLVHTTRRASMNTGLITLQQRRCRGAAVSGLERLWAPARDRQDDGHAARWTFPPGTIDGLTSIRISGYA